MPHLYEQLNVKSIIKTSLVILITAESACILTADNSRRSSIQKFHVSVHPIIFARGSFYCCST